MYNRWQKKAYFAGALLIALGMFTGLWSAAALSNVVRVGIPHLALAAHLNGLIGGFLLFAVGASFKYLSFDERSFRRFLSIVVLATYANWFITLVASFAGVSGLKYDSNPANNIVAFGLQTCVVLPSLVASIYWIIGFRAKS